MPARLVSDVDPVADQDGGDRVGQSCTNDLGDLVAWAGGR